MLLLLSSFPLIVCVTALSQEGRYLTDFVGKVKIPLEVMDPAQYNLSPAETSVIRQNLQRLRDLLIAQPTLNPPRGVEVDGAMLIDWTSLCHEPPCPKVTVAFSGIFRFREYYEEKGKPVFQDEAEAVMSISANNPDGTLGSVNSPVYEGIKDLKGHSVFFQPPKIGELGGFLLYRNYPKNVDILVLTKNPKPYWVPMDSEMGTPLVIANPDFLNPALPRTAIQVIAIFFKYGPQFDPTSDKYNENNANPANLRLRDMEQKSDWRAVSSILAAP
jgi:hypothetical protein